MRLFVVTGQLDLYQQIKMNPEIQNFLENLRSGGEEEKKNHRRNAETGNGKATSKWIKREDGVQRG